MLLDKIIYHKRDFIGIGKEDAFTKTNNGMKQSKMTAAGSQLCIQWRDGSTDWVAIKDINQSYPVELEDYVNMMKIDDEPEFAWWVTYVQKKR